MEDKQPKRPAVIIVGSGHTIAEISLAISDINRQRSVYRESLSPILVVSREEMNARLIEADLPFIDIPVNVDQGSIPEEDLNRFADLAKAIEPVVISFKHMASTAEKISAALGGWSFDNVLAISTRLQAEKINIQELRAMAAPAYNPNLPDVAVPTRKKKKRGHNSARDRIFCKAAYC